MYLAGIDIGTTSICCILVHAELGTVIKSLTRPNDAQLSSSRPWEALQDPERIVSLVHELLQECKTEWNAIKAIGISCQMHGVLYVDHNGNHVSPLFTWQDRRGDERFSASHTYASYLQEVTGYRVLTGYGLVTHFYNMRNGEVPGDAAFICTIGDYAAMRLCGSSAPIMNASNAASLGMFNLSQLDFDEAALGKAGIDRTMLPKLTSAQMIVGTTVDNKPVVCAIGDNQASFLGAVPVMDRTLLFNIGTGSQVSLFSKTLIEDTQLDIRPFPGGGFLLVGASLNGGKSYAGLERFFKEICRTFSSFEEHSIYEQMNQLAEEALEEAADLSNVSVFLNGDMNRLGLLGPKQLIGGVITQMVEELLDFVKLIPDELIKNLTAASGSGNGIRKNKAMRQLLQNKLKLPFYITDAEEEAAFGAAIHAGVGSGFFRDYRSALERMQAQNIQNS